MNDNILNPKANDSYNDETNDNFAFEQTKQKSEIKEISEVLAMF